MPHMASSLSGFGGTLGFSSKAPDLFFSILLEGLFLLTIKPLFKQLLLQISAF